MKLTFEDLIVFENEDYILINKPPYVASLDERTSDRSGQSIIRLAKAYHPTRSLGTGSIKKRREFWPLPKIRKPTGIWPCSLNTGR